MATEIGPDIIADGLVFCLDAGSERSYPGTGTTWSDLISSTGLTANLSPTYSNGVFSFNSSSGFKSQTNALDIQLNTQLTMSVWYRRSGDGGAGNNRLIEVIKSGSSASAGHALILEGDGKPSVWYDDSGTTSSRFIDYATTYTPSDNVWHYFAATYDGPDIKIYIDGSVVGSTSSSTLKLDDINNITIGYYQSSSTNYFFNGDISIVKIYNKTLTQSEVTQNFNAQKNRFI